MAKKDPATETTDTILEKLQAMPHENIVTTMNGARYLIPASTIKLMAWNAIPDLIKDEKSDEAKKAATLRLGLKALIRPLLPEILRKTWGMEVEITPGLNILGWLPKYFVHYFVGFMASREWVIYVEKCESCSGDVFKVTRISPYTHGVDNAKALTAPRADSEPLQGGAEPYTPGAKDSDQPGGSMGSSGSETVGQEHMGKGTAEAPDGRVSGDANVHPGLKQ